MSIILDCCEGDRFEIKGIIYEISNIQAGIVRCANVTGGKILHFVVEKLQKLLDSGQLQLIKSQATKSPTPDKLSQSEIKEMNRRLKYVRGVFAISKYTKSKSNVTPIISDIAAEIEDEKPPCFTTFVTWMNNFIKSNKDPMSLVPLIKNRGSKKTKIDYRIESIIANVIECDYLTLQRLSMKIVYENIIAKITEEYAEGNTLPSDVVFPSISTVERRINNLDPYTTSMKRYGRYIANRKFKAAGKSFTSTIILENVEADGNILDVLIIDEDTGEVMGRPYGTCVIDQFSRCVIAFEITMIPFSASTLLRTLKTAVSCNNGGVGGLFETLIVDNGSDYISHSVRNFCNSLGITIQHGAPRDPNSKPHVERFFRRLNEQLVHTMPGTTFSNPDQKADYQSAKYASYTLDELKIVVSDWLDLFYHTEIHQGHGRVPIKLWNESLKNNPIKTYESEQLDSIARDVYIRTISNGRITLHNMQWYSHTLASIEAELRIKGKTPKVDVYLDTLDLSILFVRSPDGDMIQADAVNPDYMIGLSLYEHLNIRKMLAQKGKEDIASLNSFELTLARWEFRKSIIKHGENFAKKQIARIKEIQRRRLLNSSLTALVSG